MLLTNAFSLNMLTPVCTEYAVKVRTLSKADATKMLLDKGYQSAIGHKDTASLVAEDLGLPVEANRMTVVIDRPALLMVAQYRGPRLKEGTTTLPEDASLTYLAVNVFLVSEEMV